MILARSPDHHLDSVVVPQELCNLPVIRVCGLGTIWIQLAQIPRAEPLRVGPRGLMPHSKEDNPETEQTPRCVEQEKGAVLTLAAMGYL